LVFRQHLIAPVDETVGTPKEQFGLFPGIFDRLKNPAKIIIGSTFVAGRKPQAAPPYDGDTVE
jgi:hypothetical protein